MSVTADEYGVFGHPVSHSLSPFIHGLFARQTGHQMTYRVGVTVHHEECRLSAGKHKMFGIIAGHGGAAEKIAIPRLSLEILHSPWCPEGLEFLFGKFRHSECYMVTKQESYKGKGESGQLKLKAEI